ncbi:uncharacterized protein LOC142518757 isoform X1 [Primulina tabacum]|uniref:uncharacterized protein LOC142518757 isoform X1 n=1 Tax=Primulina tabacum TaxID=48773 RepID=UPI003F5A0D99
MLRSFPYGFCGDIRRHLIPSSHRCISSSPHLAGSWMDKVKGVFTGQKTAEEAPQSMTLLQFADSMSKARKLGELKKYVVGRGSEATFSDAFEKQEAIIRYLGGCDPTGENIQSSQKKEAAKQCNCTLTEVENALSKFTWAKQAEKKVLKLKEEGKPMPKNLAEVQKLMGSSPLDVARSSMLKSGQTSRNSPCPCGSKKLYKSLPLYFKVLWEG